MGLIVELLVALVGALVGCTVGAELGISVGTTVGAVLGTKVGSAVGSADGSAEGSRLGLANNISFTNKFSVVERKAKVLVNYEGKTQFGERELFEPSKRSNNISPDVASTSVLRAIKVRKTASKK